MNSKEYKDAINQIHASDSLKEKTKEKIKEKRRKNSVIFIRRTLAACAALVLICTVGIVYLKTNPKDTVNQQVAISEKNNNLPRFQSMEELKEVIKNSNNKKSQTTTGIASEGAILENDEAAKENSQNTGINGGAEDKDRTSYSETNTQVENVDEADIVKTDGNYIYYLHTINGKIYIINPSDLELVSTIELEEKNKTEFLPREIYVKDKRIIILGDEIKSSSYSTYSKYADVAYIGNTFTKAVIYDISDLKKPKMAREVKIDGNYVSSRMIDDNLYFVSEKSIYYEINCKDEDYLPKVSDSANNEGEQTIKYDKIAYFEDTDCCSYMIVAGLDTSKEEDVSVETFFGANSNIYASENNLYVSQTSYKDDKIKSTIYKFNLKDAKVELQCKGEVEGSTNNQFSFDEYKGNLRVATTGTNSLYNETNQIYVLNENLEQIGRLGGLAKGESIYSVRFIENVAYVVTFKQVDPLFVIDMSDPTNPTLEGKLEIPGYSTYLHPYDKDHIIGIGYDVEANKYGGTTRTTIKMSMFDVSDLANPKEIFKVSIGDAFATSDIIYNHKALFYNKEKNLIGFPLTSTDKNYDSKHGFVIYKIDLEKGFEKYGEVLEESENFNNISRIIYIGDTLYSISSKMITSYKLENIEKIKELEF